MLEIHSLLRCTGYHFLIATYFWDYKYCLTYSRVGFFLFVFEKFLAMVREFNRRRRENAGSFVDMRKCSVKR
jgi:hypothetical protein